MPGEARQASQRMAQAAAGAIPAPSIVAVFALTVPDAATANLDWTGLAGLAFRVLDFWAVKTGATAAASANTVQLQTAGGVAVSDALNMQVADTVLVRAAVIDDANHAFAAGAGIRVRSVKAGENAACICYVKVALVA